MVRLGVIACSVVLAAALSGCSGTGHPKSANRGATPSGKSRGRGSAGPRVRVVTLKGSDAPGPARYDRVRVIEVGPASARRVLVLEPGTSSGAGALVPDAEDLVARLDGWQVWAVDRRENLLEDLSALDRARAGGLSGRGLFDYYAGWLGDAAIKPHYQPPSEPDLPFVREWGMRVAVEDLRRVVAAARRGGRRVVLGGHSLGGWIATAYATWDFRGHAGARDLAGLVLIDGASGAPAISRRSARRELAAIDHGDLFISIGGAQLPWLGGALAAVSATLALREPDAPSLIQAWPLLPATVKPRVRVSNRAQFGYSIDVDTSPSALAGGQAHLGGLERTGDPRGFRDGGYATVERAAQALSGIAGVDGIAWFQPARLTLDAKAIAGGVRNRAQTLLGLRSSHGDKVDMPIYAFETSFLKGQILSAARALARRSHLAERQVTLVDRSASNAHSDPLYDSPDHNDFQKTLVPFLRRVR